jgi:peptidoglycan/xylan/chitin deacetylase (PgdA/CDA1 family)
VVRRIERRLPGRAAVLGYHRVAGVEVDPWELAVTPRHFAEHLTVLQEIGMVRPLDELLGESAIGRVAARRARFAVTFDDGYLDNLEAAVPILERFQTPATVFIAPGLLDRRSFWWDVLAELVLGSGLDAHRVLSAAGASDALDGAVAPTGPIGSRTVHDLLRSQLIRRHVDAIEVALDGLAAALGFELPVPDGRPMTTTELTALAAHPLISIGVHSMTHPRLPDLPPGEVRQEIDVAAHHLDKLLGTQRRVLAYPYGASSPDVVRVAADLGFDHAVTTESRWLRRRGEALTAPRLHPRNVDGPTFDEWLRRWT